MPLISARVVRVAKVLGCLLVGVPGICSLVAFNDTFIALIVYGDDKRLALPSFLGLMSLWETHVGKPLEAIGGSMLEGAITLFGFLSGGITFGAILFLTVRYGTKAVLLLLSILKQRITKMAASLRARSERETMPT